ncbi:translation initiation factor IF-2 [Lachnospiraceae bacterium MD335]|jgi:translation initiation factor IF-2|nr:translation initiation factor IF-2 [Lachnospiraceae bacterium MD335]
MAKMKVYELAQEIGVKSAEILTVLKSKGIEVKSHMSVLEDEQIAEVRNAMKTPKSTPIKAAEAPKPAQDAAAAKPAQTPKAADAPKTAPIKKKKSIIFVSNPDNSRMKGAQIPRKPAHPVEKKAEPAAAAKPVNTVKPAPVPVQETPKPAPAPAQEAPKPASVQEAPKPAPVQEVKERPEQEKPVAVKPENRAENRDTNRDNSRDNNRSDNRGGQRRDGSRDNNRGDGRDNSRDNNRSDNRGGQRRDGSRDNNNRRDNQGGRPGQGFNSGRDNRGGFAGKGSGKNSGFVPESPVKDAEKHRDEEKRRIGQEKDKRNRKDFMYEEDDNAAKNAKGKNKPGKFIKPEKKPVEQVEEQIKVITLPEMITIKELADKMKIQPSAIVKKLFLQGQIVTVNQEIAYETAENIAMEYDILCEQEVKVDVIEELLKEDEEDPASMIARPPVICVMGHVDHGKTSLLDAIRKTNVIDKEAGGITQHIGAYTVNINDQKITFLDTPGHEAFTAMRMRGANSTDIAILVVAADDGVMPQTVEAINHAKAAGIEIIVAVNKIDKPGANIERVKQELTEYELIAEDWGGSTVFVPVSAKSGEGIEQLLEMILLTAEVLELKANPKRRARGLVIEAELDKGRGPVATILVQKGTLKVGDFVSAGAASGKVRAMVDDKGRRVKEAGPSTPVEILGLGDVPNAGEIFIAHENDKEAKYYAETFVAQNKEKLLEDTKAKMSLDDLFSQIQAGNLKELNLIIKADVQGSVEAVKQSLVKLSNEEVVVKCIHGGVGAINESDVILASASNAIIIGFNVRPDAQAKTTAEREGVDVRLYKVIYQAIEDIEAAMKGMLDPVFEEKVIGHAEVRQIFKASAVGNIAGSYVLDGIFQRGCKIRISREGEQIYEGELASLKRFKDDVKEVRTGFECGLVFEGFDSMQELDIVEAYIMVEVPR